MESRQGKNGAAETVDVQSPEVEPTPEKTDHISRDLGRETEKARSVNW